MDTYIISMIVIGTVGLAMSWVPSLTKCVNISYSIVFLLLGALLYTATNQLPWPNPIYQQEFTTRLTELVIIIALMGTGLKIDRPFSFKNWRIPLRLVTIAMVLSIGTMAMLGYHYLGFGLAGAVLLGSVLAPTDPVLAADVQVDGPNKGDSSVVKFSLTSEAGLNDGMAFPFVWMAIDMALAMQNGSNGEAWFTDWVIRDLILRIAIGIATGYIMGKLVTYLFFHLPEKFNMLHVREGLVAISALLLTYGLTEALHGYGFMAAFVLAVTIRNQEIKHSYHSDLHAFTDQIERILLAILLILFGGSLVRGLLNDLTWPMVAVGIGFVLLIRPLTTYVSLYGTEATLKEKIAISFFGIKGVGSFFYLSFAQGKAEFAYIQEIWSLTAFVVLVSIILHGITAATVMKRF